MDNFCYIFEYFTSAWTAFWLFVRLLKTTTRLLIINCVNLWSRIANYKLEMFNTKTETETKLRRRVKTERKRINVEGKNSTSFYYSRMRRNRCWAACWCVKYYPPVQSVTLFSYTFPAAYSTSIIPWRPVQRFLAFIFRRRKKQALCRRFHASVKQKKTLIELTVSVPLRQWR